jgi:hypothetical protein
MKQKTHKYELTIQFESEKAMRKHKDDLIQFENGLGYFLDGPINHTFRYGTGKTKLKKVSK